METRGRVVRMRRGFWLRLAAVLLKPPTVLLTKRRWFGAEHIPPAGPDGGGVLVANHVSKADPIALGYFVYERPRNPRFLAKEQLFGKPVLGWVLNGAQQIPVRRHTTDAAKALADAVTAVDGGALLIIHPEGTCTKDPDRWPMRGKTGAVRLALMTGKPLIPVAQWGPQELHDPLTNKFRPRLRTPVTVVAGEPIDLTSYAGRPLTAELLAEATDLVMRRIRDMLAEIRGVPAPTGPLYDPRVAARSGADPSGGPGSGGPGSSGSGGSGGSGGSASEVV